MSVRILIVDSNTVMREGLKSIISTMQNISIITSAGTIDEALYYAKKHVPDIAIINLHSMLNEWLIIVKEIHKSNDKIGIIVISKYFRKDDVYQLIKFGASAFLPINCSSKSLIDAVNIVSEGGSLMDPVLLPAVTGMAPKNYPVADKQDESCLTDRENEIIKMIIAGATTQKIAQKLELSVYTVYTHKRNIKKKLEASNDVQLIQNALSRMREDKKDNINSRGAAIAI